MKKHLKIGKVFFLKSAFITGVLFPFIQLSICMLNVFLDDKKSKLNYSHPIINFKDKRKNVMSKIIPYKNIKYYTFAENKDFQLESGEFFGPITVAYETFGTLNEDKSNAILIFHALTGDSHVTSSHDDDDSTPGWWDSLVGRGKEVDTNKYFVICANLLGGCMGATGPSSINPQTNKPYGSSFPFISVNDMANVQKRLIDSLGITQLKCVIGGSLGGMATVSMMTNYPDIARSFIVIASAYKTSSQIMAFYEVGRNAILADPYYHGGDYYNQEHQPERGLGIARMVAHITYLSTTGMEHKFGRMIQENVINEKLSYSRFGPMFAIESYLRHQSKKFIARFDANSYLYLTKAMDMYDLTQGGEKTLASEFSNVNKKVLIISFTSDWHFTPDDSWEMAKELARLGKDVSYINIESSYGHDSFLLPNEMQERAVQSFLKNVGDEQ